MLDEVEAHRASIYGAAEHLGVSFIDIEQALLVRKRDRAINDRIDEWHRSPDITEPLHDYLGMTWEHYTTWVERATTTVDGDGATRPPS